MPRMPSQRRRRKQKVVARRERAQAAAAEETVQKVDRNIKSVGDTVSKSWNGLRVKIATDMDTL